MLLYNGQFDIFFRFLPNQEQELPSIPKRCIVGNVECSWDKLTGTTRDSLDRFVNLPLNFPFHTQSNSSCTALQCHTLSLINNLTFFVFFKPWRNWNKNRSGTTFLFKKESFDVEQLIQICSFVSFLNK